MGPIIGIVIVLGAVFGVYAAVGGNMEIIIHAAPHELATIFGAAIGALVVANKGSVLKKVPKALVKALKGPSFKKDHYKELLLCLFLLCKLMKAKGMIAVEQHVEKPEESSIFKQFPAVVHDHFAIDLICDSLRTMTMGMDNPYAIEDMIEKKLEKHHHEDAAAPHALQQMAEGLPAIGIVAAVLGVIKTMASINEPPAILGAMIGGALVGTFLGVFLSYCLVGPLGGKAMQSLDQDQQFYFIIRDVIVAHLKGLAPQLSMEIGRGNVPTVYQPTFAELEQASGEVKAE
jgi:chemotaxis protein MotA